jgi:uncharacterized membrane protein YgcG
MNYRILLALEWIGILMACIAIALLALSLRPKRRLSRPVKTVTSPRLRTISQREQRQKYATPLDSGPRAGRMYAGDDLDIDDQVDDLRERRNRAHHIESGFSSPVPDAGGLAGIGTYDGGSSGSCDSGSSSDGGGGDCGRGGGD